MTHEIENYTSPRQYAEQTLNRSDEVLAGAAAIISPEQPGASPLEVFPAPSTVRSEATGLELSVDQELGLRQAAAELGFGRETDRTVSELALNEAHVIIEGGLPHKVVAEALSVIEDSAAEPSTYIFAGSPYRSATSPAEVTSAEKQFGAHGDTEYDNVLLAIKKMPGFTALDVEQILPFGYSLDVDYTVSAQPTGQFKYVGNIKDVPVVLMSIDREDYVDEAGQPKYRNQPDTAAVIKLIDQVSSLGGDTTKPIAFVTSSTYQASREVDAAKAALDTDRIVGVPSYGTARLAAVKGETLPSPAPINQLPGELHELALKVESLRKVLEQ